MTKHAERILYEARVEVARAIGSLAKLMNPMTPGVSDFTPEFQRDIAEALKKLREIEDRIGAYDD
jgi:predicted xylose isomerase-like sugar epimerase